MKYNMFLSKGGSSTVQPSSSHSSTQTNSSSQNLKNQVVRNGEDGGKTPNRKSNQSPKIENALAILESVKDYNSRNKSKEHTTRNALSEVILILNNLEYSGGGGGDVKTGLLEETIENCGGNVGVIANTSVEDNEAQEQKQTMLKALSKDILRLKLKWQSKIPAISDRKDKIPGELEDGKPSKGNKIIYECFVSLASEFRSDFENEFTSKINKDHKPLLPEPTENDISKLLAGAVILSHKNEEKKIIEDAKE